MESESQFNSVLLCPLYSIRLETTSLSSFPEERGVGFSSLVFGALLTLSDLLPLSRHAPHLPYICLEKGRIPPQ